MQLRENESLKKGKNFWRYNTFLSLLGSNFTESHKHRSSHQFF